MVRGLLSGAAAGVAALAGLAALVGFAALAGLAGLGALAPRAEAANTRVAIGDYSWSRPRVRIDLGETVIWDWVGPDLFHSVTGASPNAAAWDSDPGRPSPRHRAGDSFAVQFTQPGTYLFQCKLHASVRGEVVVSTLPGDPGSDPGPRPPLRVDRRAPTLGAVKLRRAVVRGGAGTLATAAIDERGSLDAEYYLLHRSGNRSYRGFGVWTTFIGINRFALGARWRRFAAAPGRYEAVLRAVDEAGNASSPVRKRFTILPPRRRR